ncbi:Leucine-rich repeat,Leucine-rich repeat domain, L domain-like [Cinara cedri]|uniref:Leucine-rich repeat,Leucine-rich repeat domain, L domain-like n=1 Tax=Cinara cedri TaxID=506608 RepID=A0A5E4MA27_9HEMI|nr:Leucine-rich repeat,Leucine-rich repeat domain, L domain-like [Cinara cedri]
MMTIGILTRLILVITTVSFAVQATTNRPKAQCVNSKDPKGLMSANCGYNDLLAVPDNIYPDVQVLDLRHNYIGKLSKDSFTLYPKIKKLLLSFNRVNKIEPESLEVLGELETLDLSHNAVEEVPAHLPKSLERLYLSGNLVTDTQNLPQAVGLQVLWLRACDLPAYPVQVLLPNLVELDVSENSRITELEPVHLARTCRLAKLNLTETDVFRAGQPGSHCRCRRVVEWARTYKIRLVGIAACPDPVEADNNEGDDDPRTENCTRIPDAASLAFNECMSEWEHRNTPYWAIGSAMMILAALLLVLCFCVQRRRRRPDKALQSVPASDTKDPQNNDSAVAAAAKNKSEPAALLS